MNRAPARLEERELERFRSLILERSGLHFARNRRAELERGLLRALEQSDCRDLADYYERLVHSHSGGQEWERLIACLTVGEGYFFRDRAQFKALQEQILPAIIARKRALGRQLRIWSVGCASGEEPYSIAILLCELLPDRADWRITILASDINQETLGRARAGLYSDWSFREKGWERLIQRYFRRRDALWEIDPQVREMVAFNYLNLVEDTYPSLANNTAAFDLIVCRNVTIYLTADLTRRVIERLYEALVEGGWLIVGHAEPMPTNYVPLQAHMFPGTIAYQKTGRPAKRDDRWLKAAEQPPVAEPPAAAPLPTAPPAVDGYTQAEELIAQGRPEEALERLHQLLREKPDDARVCYLLARIHANSGRWEEARQWCERALAQDTLLAEAHFLLGLICLQEQDHSRALSEMKRVVYLDRNAILGHFWLANLYREADNAERAHKSLQNTCRLLERMSSDAVIPWSDGMTAGRLLYIVKRQLGEGAAH